MRYFIKYYTQGNIGVFYFDEEYTLKYSVSIYGNDIHTDIIKTNDVAENIKSLLESNFREVSKEELESAIQNYILSKLKEDRVCYLKKVLEIEKSILSREINKFKV